VYTDIDPELLLHAYREGIFPMADSADSTYFNFYRPHRRGLLPIKDLHIPKRLQKTLRQMPFRITADEAFETVIDSCARTHAGTKRDKTWINKGIRDAFVALHEQGHTHSIECWRGKNFVGGIYGLKIGSVFCGESMVSLLTDSSKIALVHMAARLWKGGFTLFDAQFTNPHLEQFGIYEITQNAYEKKIRDDMNKPAHWTGTLTPTQEKLLLEDYLNNKSL
jgi:leucyl/phenylalanyl-tRNA--protein transferase